MRARAAHDRVGADTEPRARLLGLHVGERLVQVFARARRLLAELLRHTLDVFLERLELLLQLHLALRELLGLVILETAAPPVALLLLRAALRVAQRLLQIVRDFALALVEVFRAVVQIRERFADLRLALLRELLERLLELATGLLDRAARLLGIHLALLTLLALLVLAARLIHRLQRFIELLDCLLRLLVALLALLVARLTVRPLLLRRLAALLTLLTLLALLTLLPLLLLGARELLLELLELLLELLGLAPQRLLLPAILLGQAVAVALRVFRELLLPARELLELRDRLVDLLLRRVEGRRGLGLVLILLEIHLELEELAQVTARPTAAAATAVLLERDLDIGEHGFGAQQMLQSRLLGRHRVLQLDLGEIVGRGRHRVCRLLEIVHELLNARVDARELTRAGAARERAGLLGERALQLREHLRVVVQLLLVEIARSLFVALLDQVPGRDEDFLLTARDLVSAVARRRRRHRRRLATTA